MIHVIFLAISCFLLFALVKKERIMHFYKAGIIGGGFAFLVDYFGNRLNLYEYRQIWFPITKGIPLCHVLALAAMTIIYMNWLPKGWHRRLAYTAYLSAVFLPIEAYYLQFGALVYMNWKLWYSYLLMIIGLLIVGYLSDKVIAYT